MRSRVPMINMSVFVGLSVLLGVSACRISHAQLVILPHQISVCQEYPAQIVVMQTQSDGTTIDRTRDAKFRIVGNAPVLVSQDGLIELNPRLEVTSQSTNFEIVAKYEEYSTTCNVSLPAIVRSSPTFPREIAAIMSKSGCNLGTCHGNLHGKGGLRLSLRGDDPRGDYDTIVRGLAGRRVDLLDPVASLLLKKPSAQIAHQGGLRLPIGSQEYRLVEKWIREGCVWNAETENLPTIAEPPDRSGESLVKLEVFPKSAILADHCRDQQLSVVAWFGDGTSRDVTRWSRFEPSEVTGVSVNSVGLVHVDKPIDVAISIGYLNGRTSSRLTFLAPGRQEWNEPPSRTRLDQLVENKLQQLRIQPSSVAGDTTFLRRTFLVTVGRLPVASEVREFLLDISVDKREKWIEQLLNQPGYAYLWALRWSDLLRNEQKVMSLKGTRQWHAWMADQLANDRPMTDFVSQMITTLGSTYENPPASFHRTHRDPETAAESVGQVFLGVRMQCARCHNHPFDRWRQDDYYGLAAYFSKIKRKQVNNEPKDKFDKHIISGDEIISQDQGSAKIWHPGRSENVHPKPLDRPQEVNPPAQEFYAREKTGNLLAQDVIPAQAGNHDSDAPPLEAERDSSLRDLANWLTHGNRMFARNMANRIWFHIMGRGIVDPPDDFRDSNPASNPELLEYLTDEFIASNYSTRHVSRLILQSQTYARIAYREVDPSRSLNGLALFAGYPLHRMPAEVLADAISDVTDVIVQDAKSEIESDVPTLLRRVVAQADVPTRSGFLTTFGKPNRLLVCECERSSDSSLGQSLSLVNGLEVREKLAQRDNRLSHYLDPSWDIDLTIEDLYLTTLTRFPTTAESTAMKDYIQTSSDRRQAMEDLLWALLNSKEFSLIQ